MGINESVARAREVAEKVLVPNADAVDADAQWPEAGIRALLDAGLGGLVVNGADGGLGHGLEAVARVSEALGQACGSTAMCFGMHCVGAAVLSAKATADQRERFLAPIAAGEHVATIALSEPGTGSHFYLPQTRIAAAGEEAFRITGSKAFVTNGGHADTYVVSTTASDVADPGEFSCVAVPGDADGIRWGAPWRGSGMRGNASRDMTLDGVEVPRRNLLGDAGDQIWFVFNVVAPYFLAAMAGTYLGIATAALEEARGHLVKRRYAHSGSTLSGEPVLQHRVGALWSAVERTRQLVYHAARSGDLSAPDALPAIMSAKAEAADCAVHVANGAMTLMGGAGFAEGSRADRHLRDARAAPVMAPTTDILRTWTGRWLLEEPLLGD